jgi:hypothetical protein
MRISLWVVKPELTRIHVESWVGNRFLVFTETFLEHFIYFKLISRISLSLSRRKVS